VYVTDLITAAANPSGQSLDQRIGQTLDFCG
jgi:hypothetical protein